MVQGERPIGFADRFDRPLPGWAEEAGKRCEIGAERAELLDYIAFSLAYDPRPIDLVQLQEAVAPIRVSLDRAVAQEDWRNASIAASNLSEVQQTLGEVAKAITLGERSVHYAERSGDAFWRMGSRTTLADTLHQTGERARAEALFEEAENLQAEREPEYPRLYSFQGYRYCDLLLDLGRHPDVRDRASYAIELARRSRWLLATALDHLSLGRAELLAYEADESGGLAEAERYLNESVDGLRASGNMDDLPRGLLGRAAFFRITAVTESFERARRDLDEAMRVATRSGMRLHECDAHLEYARLELAQGKREAARGHLDRAEELIAATGYHRRDKDLAELKAAIG